MPAQMDLATWRPTECPRQCLDSVIWLDGYGQGCRKCSDERRRARHDPTSPSFDAEFRARSARRRIEPPSGSGHPTDGAIVINPPDDGGWLDAYTGLPFDALIAPDDLDGDGEGF